MHKNIYSIIKVFLILTCEKDLFLIEFISILFEYAMKCYFNDNKNYEIRLIVYGS